MSKELFETPQQDSPRLAWIKRHGLKVTINKNIPNGGEEDEFGNEAFPCECRSSVHKFAHVGLGDTEDEAIRDWAIRNGRPLWNEEGFA